MPTPGTISAPSQARTGSPRRDPGCAHRRGMCVTVSRQGPGRGRQLAAVACPVLGSRWPVHLRPQAATSRCTWRPRVPSWQPCGAPVPPHATSPCKAGCCSPTARQAGGRTCRARSSRRRAAVTVTGRRQAAPGTCLPRAAFPPTTPSVPAALGVASGSPQRSLCLIREAEVVGGRQGSASTRASVGR